MTTPLLIALALGQGAASPAPSPTAASLISKMFAKYASAKTLTGTIKMTQSAENVSLVTDTRISYERPSKIRLDQSQGGSKARSTTLVSDGTLFAYTPPSRLISNSPFVVEKVKPDQRPAQTIGDMYAVVASDIPDRSASLDTIIGRPADLQFVKDQFKQFALAGPGKVGDRDVQIIRGTWQEYPETSGKRVRPMTGQFELCITDDGDLVRYTLNRNFGTPTVRGVNGVVQPGQAIAVTTVWDVNVKVGETLPEGTFAMKTR